MVDAERAQVGEHDARVLPRDVAQDDVAGRPPRRPRQQDDVADRVGALEDLDGPIGTALRRHDPQVQHRANLEHARSLSCTREPARARTWPSCRIACTHAPAIALHIEAFGIRTPVPSAPLPRFRTYVRFDDLPPSRGVAPSGCPPEGLRAPAGPATGARHAGSSPRPHRRRAVAAAGVAEQASDVAPRASGVGEHASRPSQLRSRPPPGFRDGLPRASTPAADPDRPPNRAAPRVGARRPAALRHCGHSAARRHTRLGGPASAARAREPRALVHVLARATTHGLPHDPPAAATMRRPQP